MFSGEDTDLMNKMEGEIGGGVTEQSKALFWMLHLKYQ